MIEEKLTDEQAKLVNTIQELIDCDKKQNEFGGIIIVNRHFLNEVLNLINRLKEENKVQNKRYNDLYNKWLKDFKLWSEANEMLEEESAKLKSENERLTRVLENKMDTLAKLLEYERKETAEKFEELLEQRIAEMQGERDGYESYCIDDKSKYDGDIISLAIIEVKNELAKQFGVEIGENK